MLGHVSFRNRLAGTGAPLVLAALITACAADEYRVDDAAVVDGAVTTDSRRPDQGDQGAQAADSVVATDTVGPDGDSPRPDLAIPTQTVFGGNRPTELFVPSDYDPTRSYPLVITLHGYGSDGEMHLQYLGYGSVVDTAKALVAAPDGTSYYGTLGWNSIPEVASPDDAGYLVSLIEEIRSVYNVDPERVFIVGHSAGGFMAYRMACEHADLVRGIVVLGASTFYDEAECKPAQPVGVLHIHGTADDQVNYGGGYVVPLNYTTKYPPVPEAVSYWAGYNGCSTTLKSIGTIDIDTAIAGAETKVEGFDCPQGTGAELWTVQGAKHFPSIVSATFASKTLQWLLDH